MCTEFFSLILIQHTHSPELEDDLASVPVYSERFLFCFPFSRETKFLLAAFADSDQGNESDGDVRGLVACVVADDGGRVPRSARSRHVLAQLGLGRLPTQQKRAR